FGINNSCDIKKQCALSFIFKTMRTPQRVLFRNSGNRKGLAGKAGKQNIMVRNRFLDMFIGLLFIQTFRLCYFLDITVSFMITMIIGEIGLYRILIIFARENAFASFILKTSADAANPCYKIN